jgi:hypothetical protein
VKLVGDRHSLTDRQRLAVARAACSNEQKDKRAAARVSLEAARGDQLLIDGFNTIITLEAALSGGVLIACRDGCLRDLASVHGSYRSVSETERAIALIGEALAESHAGQAIWLLDKPVSNSGRLAGRIKDMADERAWDWRVEVVANPDSVIVSSARTAVTSDSVILDRALRWVNLGSRVVGERLPEAWVVDLSE